MNVVMVLHEHFARTSQTGLDFVGNEQHILTLAYLSATAQVGIRGHDHAVFALDRLHQERNGIRCDRGMKCSRITVGNNLDAGRKGAETIPILFFGAEANDGGRASMKIAVTDDYFRLPLGNTLDLVAPFAHQLDRRLDSFRAAVHRQNFLIASQVAEFLEEWAKLVVVERAGSKRDAACLLDQRLSNLGMCVALIDSRIGAQAVKITFAVYIGDPYPRTFADNDIQRVIVVGPIFFFKGDKRLRNRFHDVLHTCSRLQTPSNKGNYSIAISDYSIY